MASTKPCEIPEQELIIKVGNKIVAAMTDEHPFTMSFKDVQKMFNSQVACAYSGQLFGTIGDITFERINPRIGYVKGNVVLVKSDLNSLKGKTIDKFIHFSGMPLDAMADLFATLSKSLRKEFLQQQAEAVAKREAKSVEDRIAEEVKKAVEPAPQSDAPTVSPEAVALRGILAKAMKGDTKKPTNPIREK